MKAIKRAETDQIPNAYSVVHWYKIKVIDEKRNIVEQMSWSGLMWDQRLKYDWYFKYRSALLQVKYPRHEVQVRWGNEPAQGKTLEQINKAKITAKKATLTKYRNKLKKAEETWSGLFPIKDDLHYKKACAKIERLQKELNEM